MQPFCGDALFLGLLKHRGTDRHWYGRAAAQSSLSGGGLPLTSQRSAWLFGERCESIRRTLLHTLMVKLLINYMIMSLDVFWRCWGYTVMFVEWYVCMFSDEFTVVFIAVKVQRGCSTSPLLYLLEKSWTTPCYSSFHFSVKGIRNCRQESLQHEVEMSSWGAELRVTVHLLMIDKGMAKWSVFEYSSP